VVALPAVVAEVVEEAEVEVAVAMCNLLAFLLQFFQTFQPKHPTLAST
jgi:hypothetical protein